MPDQLFASFILDAEKGVEIALKAENVSEATPINGAIRHLPAAIDYLEGIMALRQDLIPVINLKKRLGFEHSQYNPTAKVAVVTLHDYQFGLLIDDIQEVFRAGDEAIMPISSVLQTDDHIISAIIRLDNGKRTIELLDIGHLFKGRSLKAIEGLQATTSSSAAATTTTYSRWVIFSSAGQLYGVPVKYAREIAFFSGIDDTFKSGNVEGAIRLREKVIPVLSSRYLLNESEAGESENDDNRVLVLASEDCSFGMMVDDIREIVTVADNDILAIPSGGSDNLLGIYPQPDGTDIMLLDMPNLVCNQIEDIKSLSRLSSKEGKETGTETHITRSHHVITENCYLIFTIHKFFAIELKDVQEIIESENIMKIPRANGYGSAVINLRGAIVPVIDVRAFYDYPANEAQESKLIICRGHGRTIALEVDAIVTIYKQEEYHSTPSLNPRYADKKDTLDRLIEFEKEDGLKEHVLVVNIHNMVGNHLEFKDRKPTPETEQQSETLTS